MYNHAMSKEKSASRLVVNIIGYPGCGKSTVCRHLADTYGFWPYRTSDGLRAYAADHGIELEGRQDYIDCHQALNQEDPAALIRPIFASSEPLICVDGLRAPFLLDRLLERPELRVVTIALDCPIEKRYERAQSDDARQGTHRDRRSLADFRADELPDYSNPDPNLPNMTKMMSHANYTVDASGDPHKVERAVDSIITKLLAHLPQNKG